MKFNEFAQTYKLHIQAHLKPRTVEQYSDILRRILVPRFGKRELTDVRLHDLRHSYATCAVEVGISMPVIGGFSGTRQSRRHHAIFRLRIRVLKRLRSRSAVRSVRISFRGWRNQGLLRTRQDVIGSGSSEFQTAFDRIEHVSAQAFCLRRTIFQLLVSSSALTMNEALASSDCRSRTAFRS